MDGHFCYKHRVTMLSGLPMVMDLEEINPFLVSLAKSPGSIFLCHSHRYLVICGGSSMKFALKQNIYLPITFIENALQLYLFLFYSISGKP